MEDLRAPGLNFGMASHWSHPNLEQGFSAGSGDIWQCVETFLVVTNWVGVATGIWSVEASFFFFFFIVVQSLSCVQLFATPWTAAH